MDEIAQGEGEEENMLTEPVKLFPSCRQTALNSLRVIWLHNEGTCPSQSSSSAWPGLPQPTWTPAAGLYLGHHCSCNWITLIGSEERLAIESYTYGA